MSPRKPDVGWTVFHALDPRDCTCGEDACVAAAIELTGLRDDVRRAADEVYGRPPPARCDDPVELLRDEGDADVTARRGAR